MKTAKCLLPIIAFLFFSSFLKAQEIDSDPTDSPELYQVEYFKFDEGTSEEARRIIDDYFSMANQLAGIPNPVLELELNSDDYNYMVVWELLEGEENLNWQTCPTDTEWYDAFVTVAGSEEKAKELIEKYDSYISASKTEFARKYK